MTSLAFFFLLFTLVSSKLELVLEEGYEVTTLVDGHKVKINPHSVMYRAGSSDFVVLDSAASRFYTFSFPLSEESVVKRLSGDGNGGFADGKAGSARFSNPKNFAIDLKGNVYVADRTNHAIRKITNSGVTTIAGGISKSIGRQDGPAQNASFSDDFDLTFVPDMCALLISDRGSQLLRQINLKAEDCAQDSHSVLGAVSAWVLLGWVFSCLLCVIIGIVIRPYIICHEGPNLFHFSVTWRHYLTKLLKQVLMLCFGIRSVIVSCTLYALLRKLFWWSLSYLSLMFRVNYLESKTLHSNVSLLDSDNLHGLLDSGNLHGREVTKSRIYFEQLKDLISFDDLLTQDVLKPEDLISFDDLSTGDVLKPGHGKQESSDALLDSHGKKVK